MLLTIMSEHKEPKKVNEELEESRDNDEKSTFPAKNDHPF